jgi:small subunit ribosomal protein S6
MVIVDAGLDDAATQATVQRILDQIEGAGGRVASTDRWGRRRFAYEIDHKHEGYYVVFEVVVEGGALDALDRSLRLADEIVRHKLVRLPDAEAERRGHLGSGQAAPADAG